MRRVAAIFAFILTTSSAFALLDDGTSSLGCYFDQNGDTICLPPTPFTPFSMYFILANPDVTNLGGFEFGWRFDPEIVPAPMVLDVTMAPGASNAGDNGNFVVNLGQGLTSTPATVLVRLNLMMMSPVSPGTWVVVGPSTPTSIPDRATYGNFQDPTDIRPMNFSTWPEGEPTGFYPVARMWCTGWEWVISNESRTWGDVKALFQ